MSKHKSLAAEITAIQEIAKRTGRIGLAKSLDQILARCQRDAEREDKQQNMRPVVSTHTGSTPILTWIEPEEEARKTQSLSTTTAED